MNNEYDPERLERAFEKLCNMLRKICISNK